jgi:metal-responsive CopG/Arc/MetJ family transcriptional regulator
MPYKRRKDMTHIGVWIKRDLLAEFKKHCQEKNCSMSEVIRLAIKRKVYRCKKETAQGHNT